MPARCILRAVVAFSVRAFIGIPGAIAQQRIPDFSEDATVGWLAAGNEFHPDGHRTPSGQPDPAHPYIQNARRGRQPTLRVADSTIRSCSLG